VYRAIFFEKPLFTNPQKLLLQIIRFTLRCFSF